MQRPNVPAPDPIAVATFAGCTILDTAANCARHKLTERRQARRVAEVRAIVTDRLHMTPEELLAKYDHHIQPIV